LVDGGGGTETAVQPDPVCVALGEYIRVQRRLAQMSLRQLAQVATVSSAYLSQLERGQYRPSAHVLKSIAQALRIPPDMLYEQAGLLSEERATAQPTVEQAIAADPDLTPEQKTALIQSYRTLKGVV
jgi:transcriptional regulator with XRE-family HTH domain